MESRYKYIKIEAVLTFCMMVLCACGNSTSEDGWGKSRPFDQEEYDRAYDIYIEHFDDELEDVPRLNAIADSLYESGDKKGNYAVQINALMMKVIAYTIKDENDSITLLYQQAMQLAKANGHQHLYFSIYNNYCQDLFASNSVSAMREAKKMFDEANELNSPSGRKNGHRMLGSILQYQHNNSASAIREYKMAEAIADSMGSSPIYMFDLQMDMAVAYASNNQLDEAEKILAKARKSEVFDDPYCQTSYNITRLSVLEKGGTTEEYNEVYKKVFDDASSSSRFTDEKLKDWHVRMLIKNRRFDEAEKEIAMLKDPESYQARLSTLYENQGDYRKALNALDRLHDVRDSIRYCINMNDIINMETQLHNAELKKKAEEAIAQRRLTAVVAVAVLLLFIALTSIVFIHRQRLYTKRLEEANNVKTKFLQSMSHELRTPINHISGFAQLMEGGMCDDPEVQKQAASAIVSGTDALTHMIENIMLIIDESSENRVVEMRSVDVQALVAEVCGYAHIEEGKNVKVVCNAQLPDVFTLKSSDVMIKQVLTNMLSNAIKFTQEGTVTIDVCLEPDADKPSALSFVCTDTGCGIAPEHREAIFERFFKVDKFVPGIGLGLSVCRVIARKLHGKINLDHTYVGPGSRFVFTLPL